MEVLSRCPVGLRSRCVRVPEAVVYGFADSRSGGHARAFLADWRGSLICDDYGGYKAIFDNSMSDPTAWLLHQKINRAMAATACGHCGCGCVSVPLL